MKINVGDYVRTRKGIDKIIRFVGQQDGINIYEVTKNGTYLPSDCFRYFIFENDIIKSSSNIIDLIEVGDYVNGDRVVALKGDIEKNKINNEDDIIYTEYINDYDEWCGYEKEDIKSIVTKDQFSQMEYRINE